MIRSVVLPYARPGILAACFLALGRALGETMAVTMLIGNVRYLNFSVAVGAILSPASLPALCMSERPNSCCPDRFGLILFLITADDASSRAGR